MDQKQKKRNTVPFVFMLSVHLKEDSVLLLVHFSSDGASILFLFKLSVVKRAWVVYALYYFPLLLILSCVVKYFLHSFLTLTRNCSVVPMRPLSLICTENWRKTWHFCLSWTVAVSFHICRSAVVLSSDHTRSSQGVIFFERWASQCMHN